MTLSYKNKLINIYSSVKLKKTMIVSPYTFAELLPNSRNIQESASNIRGYRQEIGNTYQRKNKGKCSYTCRKYSYT